jgi:hypothetical protein
VHRVLRASVVSVLLAAPLAAPPAASAQCAMCKTALTNSEEGRAMSVEFNHAILVMLAAPYILMGAAAAYLFRRRIRAFALRAAAVVRTPGRSAVLRG